MTSTKEDRLRLIIACAYQELLDEHSYRQNVVVSKLHALGCHISLPTFSNILNGKPVALATLSKTARAMQYIVDEELGKTWNASLERFDTALVEAWHPRIIEPLVSNRTEEGSGLPGLRFHLHGRVSIREKTDFIQSAHHEVLEVGVRLRTFTDYFFSRSEQEYKAHIVALAQRGVRIGVYMLDPASHEAAMYFNDRGKVQKTELRALDDSAKVLEKLEQIMADFADMPQAAAFEAYLFRHIPYCHFLAVDPFTDQGKMMISPYLYGVKRADCPVFEVMCRQQPALFRKYRDALAATIRDARPLKPSA